MPYEEPSRKLSKLQKYHLKSIIIIIRSLCCLHRAKALVPYDEHGRRCTGEKMWLNLQVITIILITTTNIIIIINLQVTIIIILVVITVILKGWGASQVGEWK